MQQNSKNDNETSQKLCPDMDHFWPNVQGYFDHLGYLRLPSDDTSHFLQLILKTYLNRKYCTKMKLVHSILSR